MSKKKRSKRSLLRHAPKARPKRAPQRTRKKEVPTRRKPAPKAAIHRITPIVALGPIWDDIGVLRPLEFRVTFARPDDRG